MLLKFNSLHYAKPHLHEKSRDNISQRNWIQPNRLTERLRIACCLPRQTKYITTVDTCLVKHLFAIECAENNTKKT